MSRFSFFSEAFSVVVSHPKLVIPKLVVAVVYGFLMLESARLAVLVGSLVLANGLMTPSQSASLLGPALVLLAGSIVALLLDVWISTWFPVLVSDFRQGSPLSFRSAIFRANRRAMIAIPLLVAVELGVSLVLAIFANLVLLFSREWFWLAMVVSGIVIFGVYLVLYPLLSVSVLESVSARDSVKRSLSLSRLHWASFSVPALFSFGLSAANFGFAFLANRPEFLAGFWVLRFVLAIVVTYVTVLNPESYFAVSASGSSKV